MNTSFYSRKELNSIGFKRVGENCKISRLASIYSPEKLETGSNVRIDDFCLLSGDIQLGNNIHISAYSALYGGGGIIMEDYSGLSPRATLLSATDDFSGHYLIGPHLDSLTTNVFKARIHICKFCQVGANSLILPGVTIGEGTVVGAMSFVKKSTNTWEIVAGIPAKHIKKRAHSLKRFVND